MTHPTKGFASLNPVDRRKIASAGGKAAHAAGTAHVWSLEEAREQGRRGGLAKKAIWAARRQAKVDAFGYPEVA